MITRSKTNLNQPVQQQRLQTYIEVKDNDSNRDDDYEPEPMSMSESLEFEDIPDISKMTESKYNIYSGQNICNFRDCSLRDYYIQTGPKTICLQSIYDIGCALIDIGIICKNPNTDEFMLNPKFGWEFAAENILDNCKFLTECKHPKFV